MQKCDCFGRGGLKKTIDRIGLSERKRVEDREGHMDFWVG